MPGFPAQVGLGFRSTEGAEMPTTPTLSLTIDGSSVVASIIGQSGVTHYLKYKGSTHSSWQDGGSRTGDGSITVSDLATDIPYIFIVYSQKEDGAPVSLPSVAQLATLAEDVIADYDELVIEITDDYLETFGETITYLPAAGGEREILAIVDRERPGALGNAPHGTSPLLVIIVANNSTTGISSTEVNTGKDKVKLAVRLSETAQERRITKILSQDAGMLKLEVR